MKRILLVIFCFILFSCNDGKESNIKPSQPSNFSMNVFCEDFTIEAENGNTEYSKIPVIAHLFTPSASFEKEHDIPYLTDSYNIFDTNGIEHHAQYSFSGVESLISHYVKAGRYYMILVISETGRYTTQMIEIEEGIKYEKTYVFKSSLPKNSFELFD